MSQYQMPMPVRSVLPLLSPNEEINQLFDRVVLGCQERNKSRVYQTLMELMSTLDFNNRIIALDYFRAYEQCIRLARANRFREVATTIQQMRDPWTGLSASSVAVVAS